MVPEGKLCQDLSITIDNTVVLTARNLAVTLDDELLSTAVAARSCRFLQYNIRKTEGSAFIREATYALIQLVVISRPDYCNFLLTGAAASTGLLDRGLCS